MNDTGAALTAVDPNAAQGPVAGAIFNSLLSDFATVNVAAGAALNESVLANRYRMPRVPLREAFRRLHGFRLVTRAPEQRVELNGKSRVNSSGRTRRQSVRDCPLGPE